VTLPIRRLRDFGAHVARASVRWGTTYEHGMKRSALLALLFAATTFSLTAQGPFRTDASGHHLIDSAGKPFFWLGDTAWLLFQMTTREDAELYLSARARQWFTVIQAALIMAEVRVTGGEGVLCPNRYGDRAFVDGDPTRPAVSPGNEPRNASEYDYWDHVEYIIDRAHQKGLVMALLPMFISWQGDGFRYLTAATAGPYGEFLGRRFGRKPNIIWVLGGDNTPDMDSKRQIWDALATGIAQGTAGRPDHAAVTMAYHINAPQTTSAWLKTSPWLDMNMLQTWDRYDQIYPMVRADYDRKPVKPVVMAEGAYENGPQYPTKPINAAVIRRQAYWSYFAGGYHTYGNTDVWNFSTYRDEATQNWRDALQSPGAAGLTVLRTFFDSMPWWTLIPDNSVLGAGAGQPGDGPVALRAGDGTTTLVYLPIRREVNVDLSHIPAGRKAQATWFDPAAGTYTEAGIVARTNARRFTPPGNLEDAILVLRAVE
jgi:hypothetical protein